MRKHLEKMQMEFRSGRADNALELHSLETNSDKWVQSMEGAVSLDEGVDKESRIVLHDACRNELCAILNKTVLNKFMNEYASGDGAIVRKHNQIREVLFTPMKVAKGPADAKEVGMYRYTVIPTYNRAGNHVLSARVSIENWRTTHRPHKRVPPYRGWTLFLNNGLACFSSWMQNASVREGVTGHTLSPMDSVLV